VEFEFAVGTNARSVLRMKYTPSPAITGAINGPSSPGSISISAYSNASAFSGPQSRAIIGCGRAAVVQEYTEVHKGSVYCMDYYHNNTNHDNSDGSRLVVTASNDKNLRIIK
jgi:hypothetical protein